MVEILIQPNLKVTVSWYQKLYFWADITKTKNLHKIEIFLTSPLFVYVLLPDMKRSGPINIKGTLSGLTQFMATYK